MREGGLIIFSLIRWWIIVRGSPILGKTAVTQGRLQRTCRVLFTFSPRCCSCITTSIWVIHCAVHSRMKPQKGQVAEMFRWMEMTLAVVLYANVLLENASTP